MAFIDRDEELDWVRYLEEMAEEQGLPHDMSQEDMDEWERQMTVNYDRLVDYNKDE